MTANLRKLAIISTHPIQYNAPLFKLLRTRGNIDIKVFYTWGKSVLDEKYDPGFGRVVSWDIPLLQGYEFEFLDNVSKRPGSDHFTGIDNPDLVRKIDAWGPDAILVYGWNYKSHLRSLIHYKRKMPVFFRGDSTCLDDKGLIMPALRRLFLWAVYSCVDKAFYPGISNKIYLQKAYMGDKKLVFAPHAVDNDFFLDRDGDYALRAREWRKELGIGENALVFLFAGKLEKKKSPFLLLDAFVSGNFPEDVHLVFTGNGALDKNLKERAGSRRNIHFIGFQNQTAMPAVYRLGNVFILPSGGPGETWGLGINEAMACGRPVIVSTKCGGGADLVQEGVNGYLFESGKVEELQRKMRLFLQEPERSERMGRAALVHIQNFSLARLAQAIEQTVLSTGTGGTQE
jgi:glycosyltransferase involved in cell wall biosynthesis